MRYKVGDFVIINTKYPLGTKGSLGEIIGVNEEGYEYPYLVEIANRDGEEWFGADELLPEPDDIPL